MMLDLVCDHIAAYLGNQHHEYRGAQGGKNHCNNLQLLRKMAGKDVQHRVRAFAITIGDAKHRHP